MGQYELEILAPAQKELEEIALLHLKLVGVNSARNITDTIYHALERLQSHPQMGIACREDFLKNGGYRLLFCGNYLCVYRLIGATVYVYHIVDGRADYPQLLQSLSN